MASAGMKATRGRRVRRGGRLYIANHPFVDGNKRIGHAAMEVVLILNGFEVNASVDEQERVVLAIASGELNREGLVRWLQTKAVEIP